MYTQKTITFKNRAIDNYVTVIIPVFDDPEGLTATLKSLQLQSLQKSMFEVVVGNDGDSNLIDEICTRFDVSCASLKNNMGSYSARNKALSEAAGDTLVFLDANVTVDTNYLEKVLAAIQYSDYIVGSIKIDESELSDSSHFFEFACAFNNQKNYEKFHYAPTANLIVKRRVISEVGGFDGTLRSGGDLEFGNRVYDNGAFKLSYHPEIEVIHPPRGRAALVKKLNRTMLGKYALLNNYPKRYAHHKLKLSNIIKELFRPIYNVFKTDRVSLYRKVYLIPFSIYYGFHASRIAAKFYFGHNKPQE